MSTAPTRTLRGWLEEREQAYVLAVSGKESVWINHAQRQIKTILADLPRDGWERCRDPALILADGLGG